MPDYDFQCKPIITVPTQAELLEEVRKLRLNPQLFDLLAEKYIIELKINELLGRELK